MLQQLPFGPGNDYEFVTAEFFATAVENDDVGVIVSKKRFQTFIEFQAFRQRNTDHHRHGSDSQKNIPQTCDPVHKLSS